MKHATVEEKRTNNLTLSVFLRNVLLESQHDEHWDSFRSLCDPCQMEYDFIGKIENFSEDFVTMFKVLHVPLEKYISFDDMRVGTSSKQDANQGNDCAAAFGCAK